MCTSAGQEEKRLYEEKLAKERLQAMQEAKEFDPEQHCLDFIEKAKKYGYRIRSCHSLQIHKHTLVDN